MSDVVNAKKYGSIAKYSRRRFYSLSSGRGVGMRLIERNKKK